MASDPPLDDDRLFTELQAKNLELRTRNAELERFTYTVSHDLKAPLVTIKGFISLLQRDVAAGDAERIAQDIAQIIHAASTMERLLEELLELSRVGRLVNPTERVSLSEVTDEAVALVRGHEDEVTIEVQPDMPTVLADRLRLLEVLQNLVDNAVKFTSDVERPTITIDAEDRGDEVVVSVADNGIGIPEQYHEAVFELFRRLDESMDGTGIGLALVRRIVEVHGGQVWVESRPPAPGAVFRFTLPKESPLP